MDAAGSTLLQVILIEAVNHAKEVLTDVSHDLTTVGESAASSDSRVTALAATMAKAALGVSALSGAIIAESVKAASGFNDQMQTIAGNTGLGTAAMSQMREEILKLGAQGPAQINDVADGFMRAANMGYQNADAYKLVRISWEAAIATGGSVSAMVNTLGTEMRNFHEPLSAAAHDMGLLMTAAAQGNVTLPDLTNSFSKVSIIASSIKMPLADAVSVYSELTRATHDASQAQVLWVGMVQHMIAPTAQAKTILAELSHGTVNLADDFKAFSLGQESFTSVMEKARVALKGNVQETFNLFGGLRGGLGALKLLGSGWADYLRIQDQVKNHTIDVNTSFNEMQAQVGSVLKTLGNNVHILAITIGEALLPPIEKIAQDVIPVVQAFQSWASAHSMLVAHVLELSLAFGGLVVALKAVQVTGGFIKGTFTDAAAGLGILKTEEQAATASTLALAAAERGAAVSAASMVAPEAIAGAGALGESITGLGTTVTRLSGLIVPASAGVEALGAGAGAAAPEVAAAGVSILGLSAGAAVATGGISLLATGLAVAYVKNKTFHDGVNSLADDLFGGFTTSIDQAVSEVGNLGAAFDSLNTKFEKANNDLGIWAAHILQGYGPTKVLGDGIGWLAGKINDGNDALNAWKEPTNIKAWAASIQGMNTDVVKLASNLRLARAEMVANAFQAQAKENAAIQDRLQSSDPGVAGKQFTASSKYDSDNLKGYTAALAGAIQSGSKNVGDFAANAGIYAAAVKSDADAMTEAKDRIARAQGDWVAVNHDTATKLQTGVNTATAALIHGLQTPGSNLTALAAAAAKATNAQTDNARIQAQAAKLIEQAGGETVKQFNAAAKAALDFGTALSSKASKTVDALAKAIDLGTGHLGTLAASAKAAEIAVGKYADSHIKAALQMGDFGLALSLTRTKLNDLLSNAQGKLFFDQHSGTASPSTITADKAGVKEATANVKDFADATKKTTKETLAQALASGDYVKVLSLSRQKLQNTLDAAEGRLVTDKANGASPDVIGNDTQRVAEAQTKLDAFNKTITDATAKGKVLAGTFADISSAAAKKASKSLDELAQAIAGNGGKMSYNFTDLAAQAGRDAVAVANLAKAHDLAAKIIAPPQSADQIFAGWGKHLQDQQQKALDTLANDRYNGGGNIASDEAAVKRSTVELNSFSDAVSQAKKAAVLPPTTFKGQESKAQADAATAAQKLARGLYEGSASLGSLKDRAIATAKTVEDYAAAHTKAAKIIADALAKAGDAAAAFALKLSNLQTEIGSKTTEASGLAFDPKTGANTSTTVLHAPTPSERAESRRVAANSDTGQGNSRVTQYDSDIATLIKDAQLLDGSNKATAAVNYAVALGAGHFNDALTILTTQLTGDLNNAVAGATLDILQHGAATQADKDAINRAAVQSEAEAYAAAQSANLLAVGMMDAAKAAGHFADFAKDKKALDDSAVTNAFDTITGAIEAGVPVTQDMIDGWRRAKATQDADTAAVVRTSIAVGDLATAFSALSAQDSANLASSFGTIEGAIKLGLPVTAAMIESYTQNKAAVDKDTAATQAAYAATGQWAAYMSGVAKQIGDTLSDATAKIAKSFLETGSASDADIQAGIRAREGQDKVTQANWDAAFSIGDLSTKSQMLSSAFSGLISRQSQLQGAQSAVDQANIAVIAANSALEVAGINAETSAISNMSSIVAAQSKVQTATFGGQLAAINDQTTILQDLSAISLATSPGLLKVAQDQLAIDRVKAQADQAAASWARTLALDELKTAQDKAAVDAANASANAAVLMDHLKVAQIAVKIALDLQKIGIDTLVVLQAINSNLGGVEDYSKTINADLTQLSKDQADSTAAQYKEASDQAAANMIAAQGAQLLAIDGFQSARDQASATASDEGFQKMIATLEQVKALDEINNAQNAALLQQGQAILDQNTSLQETLDKVRQLEERGLDRMVGQNSQQTLDGLGMQRATNPTVR